MKLLEAIAQNARLLAAVDGPHFAAAEERQKRIAACFPRGSGFDAGTQLVSADSRRIVFHTEYHHMDGAGFYDGWTSHRVIVRADFIGGFNIRVTGRDRDGIKDYLAEFFAGMLTEEFAWMK